MPWRRARRPRPRKRQPGGSTDFQIAPKLPVLSAVLVSYCTVEKWDLKMHLALIWLCHSFAPWPCCSVWAQPRSVLWLLAQPAAPPLMHRSHGGWQRRLFLRLLSAHIWSQSDAGAPIAVALPENQYPSRCPPWRPKIHIFDCTWCQTAGRLRRRGSVCYSRPHCVSTPFRSSNTSGDAIFSSEKGHFLGVASKVGQLHK